ncbi:phage repressor protein [Rhizobium sp. AAP43]|uniref:phage repressor protein n=1 Tax=Rhizobium sp. AAP43 TaxID=1523420 RepID=UPI0006B8C0B5|nr:phage repressor protein [Rhizobium sp. AAP43]KPF47088.1 repressor [Rhizobium sp. AAP43]
MNKILIERLNQLLAQSGMSAQRLSIEATGAKETVRKILDGTSKNPRIDTILKLAAVLNVTPQYLMGDDDETRGQQESNSVTSPRSAPSLPARTTMLQDVPVMGTAAGSHLRGAFEFEGGIVDYVRRPPALVGTRDIYALFVEGVSMEPQYFPGDLIYVNPHKPPRSGDIVVIQCRNSANEPSEATLGIFRGTNTKFVVIGKRNPVADIEISRETVKSIHKVLSNNELFGV